MAFRKDVAKRKALTLKHELQDALKTLETLELLFDSSPVDITRRLRQLKDEIQLVQETLRALEIEGGLQ